MPCSFWQTFCIDKCNFNISLNYFKLSWRVDYGHNSGILTMWYLSCLFIVCTYMLNGCYTTWWITDNLPIFYIHDMFFAVPES